MLVLPSYRSQLIGFLRKSIDWFPYENNTGIQWVKQLLRNGKYCISYVNKFWLIGIFEKLIICMFFVYFVCIILAEFKAQCPKSISKWKIKAAE